jgi:hypothetical protein
MDGASEGEATDRRTGSGIRQKGGQAKTSFITVDAIRTENFGAIRIRKSRSVSENNGMAFASRWQVVMGVDSRASSTGLLLHVS